MSHHGIGSFLKERRKLLGLTQAQLGETAGLTRTYIVHIETGRIALPASKNRRKLAAVLGVREMDLLIAADELDPVEAVNGTPLPHDLLDTCQQVGMLNPAHRTIIGTLLRQLLTVQAGAPAQDDSSPPQSNGSDH